MDRQLKERLVGATVLVAVAVIFVPMILSGPADEREPAPGSELATAPGGGPPPRLVAGPDPARDVAPRDPRPPVPEELAAPLPPRTPVAKAQQPLQAAPPAPVAKPETPRAPPPEREKVPAQRPSSPEPRGAGWVVQLGSFSDERNAQGLRTRLLEKGYRAFAETSTVDGVRITRVLIGPDAAKASAEGAVGRLYEDTGLRGIVLRYGE